jgi:hydrogenase nickel incorporation protein HypB
MEVKTLTRITEANDAIAAGIKSILQGKKIMAINLIGAPGSGKTTLLEHLIPALETEGLHCAVIEGDMCTSADAERIGVLGIPVVQINTENMGGACHLDANMIRAALGDLPLEGIAFLFIENVGNLVCPAEFEVGEEMKAVVLSAPEGDDKPSKYPLAFSVARLMILNKVDLIPYTNFNLEKAKVAARRLNPDLQVFETSARTNLGISQLARWLINYRENIFVEGKS